MQDLKQTRANLTADESKKFGDGTNFPFWETPDNKTTTLRFLPDADPENPYFWRIREVIKLTFDGNVSITVPCASMFGLRDKIIDHTRPWWKDPAKEALARQYYKKRSYICQGFVVATDVVEKAKPENAIRRFVLNKGVYDLVKAGLMNPDIEDHPCDYKLGRDFRLTKTKKPGGAGIEYADYGTSSFAFKVRALSKDELNAIEKYGLVDLKTTLGRVPDADEWAAIYQMFKDSLDGKEYDAASFGKYFTPYSGGGREETGPTVARANAGPQATAILQGIHNRVATAHVGQDAAAD